MKISIDTKEDSHQDIRRVIKMLQHLVGDNPVSNFEDDIPKSNNIFDDPDPGLPTFSNETNQQEESPAPTNAFNAMFGGEDSSSVESNEYSDDGPVQVASYGQGSYSEKKLDLDAEIVPY